MNKILIIILFIDLISIYLMHLYLRKIYWRELTTFLNIRDNKIIKQHNDNKIPKRYNLV